MEKKKYLIDEDEAQLILGYLAEMPYKQVYQLCDIMRNLDLAPNVLQQIEQYHKFIMQKGLRDEFISFLRWLPGMDEQTQLAAAQAPLDTEQTTDDPHDHVKLNDTVSPTLSHRDGA